MMPEILTESFCERCGTRYTFESAAPRKARRLGQIKTLSKGMKNWVMSDDTSLDEAMAAARNDDERELTTQQLDAFHSTFNFCMNCRQYTCANCWNAAEGRCLTCAPHLGHEILSAPFPEGAGFEPARIEAESWPEIDLGVAASGNGNGHEHLPGEADPWAAVAPSEMDGIAEIDPAARLAFLSGEAPAPTLPARGEPALPEPVTDASQPPAWAQGPTEPQWPGVVDEPAESFAAAAETALPAEPVGPDWAGTETPDWTASEPEPLPPTVEDRAATGATRTSDLLRRFRPGQSLDAELAAYEAELERQEATAASAAPEPVAAEPVAAEGIASAAPEPETAPVAAAAPVEPESLVAASPESVVAPEPEVAPEPIAATVEPAPAEPEPAPAPIAAEPAAPEPVREDRVEQPTWRIFAPDAGGVSPTPPAPAPAPIVPPSGPTSSPQWPVRPDQAESPAMALLASRRDGPVDGGLWAASAQEVLAQPPSALPGPTTGVQPCSNCGLSLSATARFCRRCGTRQG
jgi:hypothetical protein